MKLTLCVVMALGLVGFTQALAVMPPSLIRTNFHAACETGVIELLHMFGETGINYLARSMHHKSINYYRKGMAMMFEASGKQKKFMVIDTALYLNDRDATIPTETPDIMAPHVTEAWDDPDATLQECLDHEKQIYEKIKEVHTKAVFHKDPHLMHFLEHLIEETSEKIVEFGKYLSKLRHGDLTKTVPFTNLYMIATYRHWNQCELAEKYLKGLPFRDGPELDAGGDSFDL